MNVRLTCLVLATFLAPTARASCQVDPDPDRGPSYSRTLMGTGGGGLMGAVLVGGTLALLGEATTGGGGLISPTEAGLILGGGVGYWLGQAVGGSWGSGTAAHRVPTSRLLVPAALWTGAGLAVFGLIGNGFEEEGTPGTDASWYVGAAVGALVQVAGMSVTTYRIAEGAGSREQGVGSKTSNVSFRFYPSSGQRIVAAMHIRTSHPF